MTRPRRASLAASMRERDIQRTILSYLRVVGMRAERLNSGAAAAEHNGKRRFIRFTFAGCPDLVALMPDGRTLWIECKRAGGKLSPDQKDFADDCAKRGVPHLVATSLDDVIAYLATLTRQAA